MAICTHRRIPLPKTPTAFLFLVLFLTITLLLILDRKGPTQQCALNRQGLQSTEVEQFYRNEQQQRAPVPGERDDLPRQTWSCEMDTCFNFSRCPLRSGFPVYFYTPQELPVTSAPLAVLPSVENSWSWKLHQTRDADRACVFVVVMTASTTSTDNVPSDQMDAFLRSLPHWSKGNHVLINLAQIACTLSERQPGTSETVLAQPSFQSFHFRQDYDIVIPPSPGPGSSRIVGSQLPPLYPAQREYLLSFWGEYIQAPETGGDAPGQQREPSIRSVLKDLERAMTGNGAKANITLSCAGSSSQGSLPSEWALCGTEEERRQLLSQSTFTLLPPPPVKSREPVTSSSFLRRLREALQQGAVPVMLEGEHLQHVLPFSEALRWSGASLSLPLPRGADLPRVLASYPDSQVLEWRRRGRWLWETYFSSDTNIVDAALAVVRSRLGISPAPLPDYPTSSLLFINATSNGTEKAIPRFQTNFSLDAELRSWNTPGGSPLFLLPSTPFDPVLPSDAKFKGQGRKSNGVFSSVLGGNAPQEMFTVMMLTYKRQTSLMAALGRLRGTPFLHKVLVVWNDPDPPSPTLSWPRIGVPVVVVRGEGNSLNNRFLPFDVIETDCVFSLDDDLNLSQDDIVHGFRIWRSERERIVGFFTRYHLWDKQKRLWLYGYTHGGAPNEMSITNTGATIFHKYYLYLYSFVMPQAIRDHVDKNKNCEDIAMNFLVAHVTRKTPIRVSSTLRIDCPGCSKTRSGSAGYWEERHECMKVFSEVYGYVPLLFTPYSAAVLPPFR